MRRLLSILLVLLLVMAAAATPAVACVGATPSMGMPHDCCDEAISAPQASSCCVVSAPTGERSFVESRLLDGKEHATHAYATLHSALFQALADPVERRGGSPPLLHVRTTPLYLQQLSLLI
jgi:hypothetical protein